MDLPPLITLDGSRYRLECITVAVGCAKMLEMTLPNNIHHMIAATTPSDTDTQEVCRKYGATCFVTNAFNRNGVKFDKGWAHNETLKQLRYNEFVLFIDANHNYQDVKRDMAAWWPKIQVGGTMAGHDWTNGGVQRAVKHFVEFYQLDEIQTHRLILTRPSVFPYCNLRGSLN